jgi:hypothetical protein
MTVEIVGMEYDWLGCDANGHVALFSTAGAGYAPEAFLRNVAAHDAAIQCVLELPVTTEARFFPDIGPDLINTWRLVAERGLYAYDCDPNGGPYHLVAAPVVAVTANTLPAEVAEVATKVRCPERFERQTVITEEMLTDQ